MNRVVVVGSLNADLTVYCPRLPKPGETIAGSGTALGPGGKGANQAVAAGRSGADVVLVGAVGDDANGAMLRDAVADAGVDVTHVRTVSGEATGMAIITVDDSAENCIVTTAGANGLVSADDVGLAQEAFDGAAVVCLCREVADDALLAAALAAREAGATVVFNASPSGDLAPELLDAVDILLVNAHEAAQLLGGSGLPAAGLQSAAERAEAWEAAVDGLAARGVRCAVVTLGAGGAVVLDAGAPAGQRVVPIAPLRVEAVDTTGAGDAFTGALAARLAAGDPLAEAARYAAVVAALATTAKGTQAAYPLRDEVLARLAEGRLG
ncbi:ribokinase [Sinomonas mesophila]|uniref:ribokinase n=1 Tax=Sinomonas mesophila TaxID=1531955 RepID=UPI0009869BFA|nr:ribokinase [Sinomonas mesophila]